MYMIMNYTKKKFSSNKTTRINNANFHREYPPDVSELIKVGQAQYTFPYITATASGISPYKM